MNKKLTDQDILDMYELYKDPSRSVVSIAKHFGVTRTTVKNVMKRSGYPLRPCGFMPGNYRGVYGQDLERHQRLWMMRHSYIPRAEKRNLPFLLSEEDFLNLVTGSCYYCGATYTSETRRVNKVNVKMLGIDRLNSARGYVLGNCVTSCKRCNTIKLDMDIATLYSHLKRMMDKLEVGLGAVT